MRIAVLTSGGVDSAVALRLLHDAGHRVTAFYLKIWLEDELAHLGACPWEEDLRHVRAVCAPIGVPVEVVPLQREYHERVVAEAIAELRAGRTPSPDVLCNERIKLGAFLDLLGTAAADGGFDAVATGHYARHDAGAGGEPHLLRAVDAVKDQTYFLHRLRPDQLARCRFPVGDLPKREVRERASAMDLAPQSRPDSQGICFLGRIPYDAFVRSHLGEAPGPIRDVATGRVLGEHRGCWFHTIGQRRGLGLGGGPWYVVAKDVAASEVWVVHAEVLPRWHRDRFHLADPAWIGPPPPPGAPVSVKLRHGPRTIPARLGRDGGRWRVELAAGDPGVADGQAAVLYDGARCLGGGWIDTTAGARAALRGPARK